MLCWEADEQDCHERLLNALFALKLFEAFHGAGQFYNSVMDFITLKRTHLQMQGLRRQWNDFWSDFTMF